MADLLLELLCEELPYWAQLSGGRELKERICFQLEERGFLQKETSVRNFATPRRLTLAIGGLQFSTPARRESRRGPRIDASERAKEGFRKSAGVTPEQLQRQGDYIYAISETPGEHLVDAVVRIVPKAITALPWKKSMRWGEGDLLFARPLRSIMCLVDGKAIEFGIAGLPNVQSSGLTKGHRFLSTGDIPVKDFSDYERSLFENKVILDSRERQDIIWSESEKLAERQGVRLIENARLLEELAAVTEWPVPVLCKIEKRYMVLPEEVLLQVISGQQKYFATRENHGDRLAPVCIAVANMEAKDGGDAIRTGNERVLRARLSDADFFYRRDLEQWKSKGRGLREFTESRMGELNLLTFHGPVSMQTHSLGVADFACEMARAIDFFKFNRDFDINDAKTVAWIAKLDLLSEMVQEFPGLQGIMGKHYARYAGFSGPIADAIGEQYMPRGINDSVPETVLGQCLSLAEKLQSLKFFWQHKNARPSGSGDLYGLRRAALGIIRIILESKIRGISMKMWIAKSFGSDTIAYRAGSDPKEKLDELKESLFQFFIERLQVYLRQRKNLPPDLVEAVLFHSDDLLEIHRRAAALVSYFPYTGEGKAVLKGYKRAANILRDEKVLPDVPPPEECLLKEEAEKNLHHCITRAQGNIATAQSADDFRQAVECCAWLGAPIDDFFDRVRVNVDEARLRENRLRLLRETCRTLERVADFSKISEK